MRNETPAKGVAAYLMHDGDHFFIRVFTHSVEERRKYMKELREKDLQCKRRDSMFEFKDYEIHHHDLKIIIDEEHASFYDYGTIDYDSKTLDPKNAVKIS
jgi:Fe-S cluster assembly iron-binding protein IscA